MKRYQLQPLVDASLKSQRSNTNWGEKFRTIVPKSGLKIGLNQFKLNTMIERYLKSLNPRSPDLIYNAQYHLWLKGEYLGVATWTQDENVGDSFQKVVVKDGLVVNEVLIPDRWELIIKR